VKSQVIFLGAPGSGKGTQAGRLVSSFGLKHVSTGDLLRSEVAKGSELGQEVKSVMDAGKLVNDELILKLLKANCDVTSGQYIFDGYPRNIVQAQALDAQLLSDIPTKAVYFKLDVNNLVNRLTKRRTCGDCGEIYNLDTLPPKVEGVCDKCQSTNIIHRKDDTEEVIRNRMDVYEGTIGPVLDYYRERQMLHEVNASAGIEEIAQNVEKILEL